MQKFSFWWIVCSVIGLFVGLVLNATSVFQWFKFKKGESINNLVTAYVLLAFLFVIGGFISHFSVWDDVFYHRIRHVSRILCHQTHSCTYHERGGFSIEILF